jgi:GTP-sensing pleiotropic transcriptional regulator CodY
MGIINTHTPDYKTFTDSEIYQEMRQLNILVNKCKNSKDKSLKFESDMFEQINEQIDLIVYLINDRPDVNTNLRNSIRFNPRSKGYIKKYNRILKDVHELYKKRRRMAQRINILNLDPLTVINK